LICIKAKSQGPAYTIDRCTNAARGRRGSRRREGDDVGLPQRATVAAAGASPRLHNIDKLPILANLVRRAVLQAAGAANEESVR
jgi:hypothetical protein